MEDLLQVLLVGEDEEAGVLEVLGLLVAYTSEQRVRGTGDRAYYTLTPAIAGAGQRYVCFWQAPASAPKPQGGTQGRTHAVARTHPCTQKGNILRAYLSRQAPASALFFFWQALASAQILPSTPRPVLKISLAGVRV